MELAALAISIVSLVVAIVAITQARRARSQAQLRPASTPARDGQDPEGSGTAAGAEIHVSLERMGHASELVVENTGDASARDVVVIFDPPSSAGGPTLHEPPFPTAVDAHRVVRVPAVITFSTPPNVHTTVRWSDDRGDHERVASLPTA
jgi:xanthine/CO dehydrogenase XdhC/CoxF family maturation factor